MRLGLGGARPRETPVLVLDELDERGAVGEQGARGCGEMAGGVGALLRVPRGIMWIFFTTLIALCGPAWMIQISGCSSTARI